MPETTLEQVRVGLLLGMQAQLGGGGQRFFFGHRSFMEFAVARFWERQLRRSCNADPRDIEELEEMLAGAPLHESESRVFPFLCEMLDGWQEDECRKLLAWAKATVADESIRAARDQRRATFKNDIRTLIRQSALAVGCAMAQRFKEPFEIGDGSVLLTISAWWLIAKKSSAIFEAPGIRITEHAVLTGVVGAGANFRCMYLRGANLVGAEFREANLVDVNLSAALLIGANLQFADLSRANLAGANLWRANLAGARLMGTSLMHSNFSGADLTGTDLVGADLWRTNLTGANLTGVIYDCHTRWPEGFVVPATSILIEVESSEEQDG